MYRDDYVPPFRPGESIVEIEAADWEPTPSLCHQEPVSGPSDPSRGGHTHEDEEQWLSGDLYEDLLLDMMLEAQALEDAGN